MSYSPTIWAEMAMTEGEKITALNNLECQYGAVIAAALAHRHDLVYYTKTSANARFFGAGNDGSGSGMDAGKLDGFTADAIVSASIPLGFILMYAGTGYTMPTGWAQYSAMNGKFPIGAGSTYALLATGGNQYTGTPASPYGTITGCPLSISEMPAHAHDFVEYQNTPLASYRKNDSNAHVCYIPGYELTHTDYAQDSAGVYAAGYSHIHGCTVSINSIDHTPPYRILQFMKRTAV
jgi:hypothetical protein